jgi:putative Holliday junction resolvase
MNILAIDFGTKNIGLAWSDTAIGVVLPFGVVHSLTELVKLINEERLDKIVVGLPVGVGGSGEKNTERVKKFVSDLQKNVSVPLDFYDERFSSQQADRMGGEASRDEKSAMVILESYLQNKKI